VAIGLGSNLGRRARQLARAVEALDGLLDRLRCSRVYETRPVGGPPGQRPYLNMCCTGRTRLEPGALLARLHAVEAEAGRRRGGGGGAPRTLDLDLLLYDEMTLDTDEVRVPHPRMAARGFVLVPLAEIAPAWRHPGAGRTVAELSADADVSGVRPWTGPLPTVLRREPGDGARAVRAGENGRAAADGAGPRTPSADVSGEPAGAGGAE